MSFLYLGSLAGGIHSTERGEIHFDCGCSYDPRFQSLAYAVMTCTTRPTHFSQHCDRRELAEHRHSHKRRRKACRYCQGAAAA